MTTEQIIEKVAEAADISKAEAKKAYEAVKGAIKESVCNGECLNVIGVGTFKAQYRAERKYINPNTKKPVVAPATMTVKFKAAKAFKQEVTKKLLPF